MAMLRKNNKYNVFLCKNQFISLNQLESSSVAADGDILFLTCLHYLLI